MEPRFPSPRRTHMSPRIPRPSRRLPRRALALLCGCAIALLAAEAGYRWLRVDSLGPTTNPRYVVHDELLGWRYRPGARARHRTQEFDVPIEIGPHGFRGPGWPPRDPNRPLVLVLGDSFAFGWGVSWQNVFSERLAARHPEWSVRNAAVSGYGTDQELLLLEELAPRLQPDAVVVVFCPNDLEEITSSRIYGHPKPWFALRGGEAVLVEPAGPEGPLARHSALWRALVKRFASRVPTPMDPLPKRRALLRALLCSFPPAAGGAPVLVVGSDDALEGLGTAACGVTPLDPSSVLAAPGPPVTYPRDGHWTAEGHRRIAEWLEPRLQRLLDEERR